MSWVSENNRRRESLREERLLDRLAEKFGKPTVDESLRLADGGIRLDKDQKLINPAKWIHKEIVVGSISRTESKVELELDSMSLQCFSCGLARGTVCRHNLATLIAANRQGLLKDEQIEKGIRALYGLGERGTEAARRLCPSCRKPLEISSQAICPKCGRAVCNNCIKKDYAMCDLCYRADVLKQGPSSGLTDRDTLRLVSRIAIPVAFFYVFARVMLYGESLEEIHPMLRPALMAIFLLIPLLYVAYSILSARTKASQAKGRPPGPFRGPRP